MVAGSDDDDCLPGVREATMPLNKDDHGGSFESVEAFVSGKMPVTGMDTTMKMQPGRVAR